ncbi:MAG TPA: PRC-barrel domain-containing protein [Rubrobacter sp.]
MDDIDRGSGQDPFAGLKDSSEEYSVYDAHYERIGRVDDVLLDERDAVSYIGVKMGFFGTNSTLVPVEIVRVNDRRHLIEIAEEAETIKHAPHFGHDETVSPDLEDRVRTYFGLEPIHFSQEPEETHPSDDTSRFGPDDRVDTEPGERMEAQDRLAGESAGEVEPAEAPAQERPGDSTEERWDRETREDGVTVHRRKL